MAKRCGRCKQDKELAEFNRNSRSPDGRHTMCRACFAEKFRERARIAPVVPATHRCARCKETFPASAFNKSNTSKWGLQAYCRECRNEYQRSLGYAYHRPIRKKLRVNKRDFIHAHKTASGCVDCGEYHVACLEFHHIDPSLKTENIASMINKNRTVERIRGEMDKCVVLCRNCHAKRHYEADQAKAG